MNLLSNRSVSAASLVQRDLCLNEVIF